MKNNKQVPNEQRADYRDEKANLMYLAQDIHDGLERQNDAFDADEDLQLYIDIIIDNKATKFLLGGPQTAGLYKFIEQICAENMYDFEEITN